MDQFLILYLRSILSVSFIQCFDFLFGDYDKYAKKKSAYKYEMLATRIFCAFADVDYIRNSYYHALTICLAVRIERLKTEKYLVMTLKGTSTALSLGFKTTSPGFFKLGQCTLEKIYTFLRQEKMKMEGIEPEVPTG